jgi:hypothetical protein
MDVHNKSIFFVHSVEFLQRVIANERGAQPNYSRVGEQIPGVLSVCVLNHEATSAAQERSAERVYGPRRRIGTVPKDAESHE